MLAGDTKILSLFGWPVGHSLSPVIFNTTFEKLGTKRTYLPFSVAKTDLKRAVEAARVLGFEGFNVTMPHKIAIMEMLDELDETAEKSGAVNTVSSTKEGLVGHNTDGVGAELALKAYHISPRDKRILLIGAGGAARAIVHRLTADGSRIRILDRSLQRARDTADKADGPGATSFDELVKKTLEDSFHDSDIIINATPIQTTTIVDQLGIPVALLEKVDWVFDLAYDNSPAQFPGRTGRISPLEMLVQQAALSYQLWFKEAAPLSLMRSALVDHLGRDWK